jgi:hypothetical protein
MQKGKIAPDMLLQVSESSHMGETLQTLSENLIKSQQKLETLIENAEEPLDETDVQVASELNLDEFTEADELLKQIDEDEEIMVEKESEAAPGKKSIDAYVGAELYNKRMFPAGCPSY